MATNWLPAVPDTLRPQVLAPLLLTLRIGPVFFLTPALALLPVPAVARSLLVVGLAAALAHGLPGALALPPHPDLAWLVGALVNELLLGGTLAFGVIAAFAAVTLAGRLLDTQVGFGLGQVLDPVTHRPVPPLTLTLEWMAGLLFLLLDGHHALLRGIARSLQHMPLGAPWPAETALPVLAKQFAGIFTLGFSLAAPVVASLFIIELALAVAARLLPQLNVFVTGLPLKVIVGLGALAACAFGIGEAFARVFQAMLAGWEGLFAAGAAGSATR